MIHQRRTQSWLTRFLDHPKGGQILQLHRQQKPYLISCQSINVNKLNEEKKNGHQWSKLFFKWHSRMVFLCSLLLLTMTDILAAMMNAAACLWRITQAGIYTFSMIREVKKENGSRINQIGKGRDQHYIPKIVTQNQHTFGFWHISKLAAIAEMVFPQNKCAYFHSTSAYVIELKFSLTLVCVR